MALEFRENQPGEGWQDETQSRRSFIDSFLRQHSGINSRYSLSTGWDMTGESQEVRDRFQAGENVVSKVEVYYQAGNVVRIKATLSAAGKSDYIEFFLFDKALEDYLKNEN